MKKVLKYMTFYDKVLIVLVMVISMSFILSPMLNNWNVFSENVNKDSNNKNKYVIIQYKNEIAQQISLDRSLQKEPIIVEVKGNIGLSKVEIFKGKVRIKEAPEKDPMKVCEKTGWINIPGPSIICVPNQITVWIEEEANDGLDGVSW